MHNDNKTLYISDLDGTLLNQSAELSGYALESLNAMIADGLNFSVATARTPMSTGKILAGLNLNTPIALLNGVIIENMKTKKYERIYKIAPETVDAVIGLLRTFELTGFIYAFKNGGIVTYLESLERKPLRDFVEERINRYYMSYKHVGNFSDINTESVIYFSLLDELGRIQPVYDALAAQPGLNLTLYKDTYTKDLWFLEMFSAGASKKNAVDYLRERYGYSRIVGFGDNYNDLPMFEACDVCVAMGNAKPEVKAAAGHICLTNDEDGVVKWILENR
jgi:Cof subfamily protein (haloacid dehalogenase superfamily)